MQATKKGEAYAKSIDMFIDAVKDNKVNLTELLAEVAELFPGDKIPRLENDRLIGLVCAQYWKRDIMNTLEAFGNAPYDIEQSETSLITGKA